MNASDAFVSLWIECVFWVSPARNVHSAFSFGPMKCCRAWEGSSCWEMNTGRKDEPARVCLPSGSVRWTTWKIYDPPVVYAQFFVFLREELKGVRAFRKLQSSGLLSKLLCFLVVVSAMVLLCLLEKLFFILPITCSSSRWTHTVCFYKNNKPRTGSASVGKKWEKYFIFLNLCAHIEHFPQFPPVGGKLPQLSGNMT